MGMLIKNAEVEQDTRELAELRGETLTSVVGKAIKKELEAERAKPRRKATLEEMRAATELFRRQTGIDFSKWQSPTKAEWDALWPTGIPEIDNS
jgi:hypothetical protein